LINNARDKLLRRCIDAQTFLEIEPNLYQPTYSSNKKGVKTNLAEIKMKGWDYIEQRLTIEDLYSSIFDFKPSVRKDEIGKYERFD
jgi:hypothetical protein